MAFDLFELDLRLDEEMLQQRDGRVLADEDRGGDWLGLRVACALLNVQRFALADGRHQRVHIPLRCIVHPKSSCLVARFEIIATLSPPDELRIAGMQPQSAHETYTRTDKATREAGLGTAAVPFSAKATEELATEQQVRSWTVSASGTGTARAMWSFVEHPQAPIPPEHALTIELDSPADRQGIQAAFLITAAVRRKGGLAEVPLIGQKNVRIALAAAL